MENPENISMSKARKLSISLRFDVIFPGWISIIFGQCLHHRHQDCKTPHHSPLSLCPPAVPADS